MDELVRGSRSSPIDADPSPGNDEAGPEMRPDAAVVDRLVSVAASRAQSRLAASSDAPADRAPRRSRRSSRRALWSTRLQQTGATLALAALLAVGWWHSPAVPDAPSASVSDAPTKGASSLMQRAASSTAPRTAALPAWDDTDDMVRLHRRIELVQARSASSDWIPVAASR
jgi:hypothetical protein